MPEKLTHKEHDARAMLLGKIYDWRDGTYCNASGNHPSIRGMVDAFTLEPISGITREHEEAWAGMIEREFYTRQRPETPYAFKEEMDDG